MSIQKIVPLKNIVQLNRLLEEGWRFCHSIDSKYVLLEKYPNRELGTLGASPLIDTLRGVY